MKLTILGCSGSFPGPESPCSAYLIEAEGYRLLMDFGTGSMSTMQRIGALYGIDAILLTHLHADHVFDACSYVVARRYHPAGPFPVLPVYAPSGAAQRLSAAYGGPLQEGILDDVYAFTTLEPGTFQLGPLSIAVERMNHPVETFGVRLTHAESVIAYSADTAPCDALLRLANGADLFLCEASYPDGGKNPPGLHLTGREAGEYATKAEVRRLLLTHLVPAWHDVQRTFKSAESAYCGPIDIVRPCDCYEC